MKRKLTKTLLVLMLVLVFVSTTVAGTFLALTTDEEQTTTSLAQSTQEETTSGTDSGTQPPAQEPGGEEPGGADGGESTEVPRAPVHTPIAPTAGAIGTPYTFEELKGNSAEDYKQFFPNLELNAYGTQLTPGSSTQVDLILSNNISTSATDPRYYKGLELRIYFSQDVAQYLDGNQSLTNVFSYAGHNGQSTRSNHADGTVNYIAFSIAELERSGYGNFSFFVRLLEGVVPAGSSLTLRPEIWYPDESAGGTMKQVAAGEELSLAVNSSMQWEHSTKVSPASVEISVSGGWLSQTLSYTASLDKSGSEATRYLTQGFDVTLDITPATSPAANVSVFADDVLLYINGREITAMNAAANGITNLSFTQNGQNVTVHFSYSQALDSDPEKWTDMADWNYEVRIQRVQINGTLTDYEKSYPLQFASKVRLQGVNDADYTKDITGSGSINLFTPKEVDELLTALDSNSLTKEVTGGKAAYKDYDFVPFEISNVELAKEQNSGPDGAVEVNDFSILDDNYHSYLDPVKMDMGAYSDQSGPLTNITVEISTVSGAVYSWNYTKGSSPDKIKFTASNEVEYAGYTYVMDQFTDEGGASAEDDEVTPSEIIAIELKFGDVYTDFSVGTPLCITYQVINKKENGVGVAATMINTASVQFSYQKDTYDPYTYSAETTESVQYAGNDTPGVKGLKTMLNLNTGSDSIAAPGEWVEYTISFANTGDDGVERPLENPYVIDSLPAKWLDFNTFTPLAPLIEKEPDSESSVQLISSGDNFTLIWIGGAELYDAASGTVSGATAYTSLASFLSAQAANIPDAATISVLWAFEREDGDITKPCVVQPGDSLAVQFQIQLKDADTLEQQGLINDDFGGFLLNYAELGGNYVLIKDEHTTHVPAVIAQPYIGYEISVAADSATQFSAPTDNPTPIKYEARIENRTNPYEGSSDLYKVVLAGRLPTGFTFDMSDEASIIAAFSLDHPDAVGTPSAVVDDTSPGYVSVQYTYPGGFAYTVRLSEVTPGHGRYDHYVLTVAADPEGGSPVLGHTGESYYDEGLDPQGTTPGVPNNDRASMLFTFTALSSSDNTGFVGDGYRNQFTNTARLYVWDVKEAGGQKSLNNLNLEPYQREITLENGKVIELSYAGNRYRFAAVTGKNINYSLDDSALNWDADGTTLGALQDSVAVTGSLTTPVISIAKTRPGVSSSRSYSAGETVSYRITLSNHSANGEYDLAGANLVDLLPPGQTFVGITSVEFSGNAGGAVTAGATTSPATNGTRIAFALEGKLLGEEDTVNGEYKLTPGVVQINYTALVTDTFMDSATYYGTIYAGSIADYMAGITVQNRAALLFQDSDAALKIYTYTSTSGSVGRVSDTVAGTGALADDWRGGSYEYLYQSQVDVAYARERISPTIEKTISAQNAATIDGAEVKWRLTVQNRRTANGETVGNTPMREPIIIDILPNNLSYAGGAVSSTGTPTLLTSFASTYDYGEGPVAVTVLVWQLKNANLVAGNSAWMEYNTTVTIPDPNDLANYGRRVNTAYVVPTEGQQDIFYHNSHAGENKLPQVNDMASAVKSGALTWDKILAEADLSFENSPVRGMVASQEIGIWGEFAHSASKGIAYGGQLITSDSTVITDAKSLMISPNDTFEYVLTLRNDSRNTSQTNPEHVLEGVEIIDRLPYYGDTGVTQGTPRDSDFGPALFIEGGESAPKVEVSLVQYDMYGAVVSSTPLVDTEYELLYTQDDLSAVTFGGANWDTAASWLDAASITDFEEVFGVRVNYKGELKGLEALEVRIPMVMPDEDIEFGNLIENYFTAWNSFGYIFTHVNNNAGTQVDLGPLESTLVGAKAYDPANASLTIDKTALDELGAPLSGGSYKLMVEGTSGNAAGYYKEITLSAANGYSQKLTGLKLGDYKITEISDATGSAIGDLYDVQMLQKYYDEQGVPTKPDETINTGTQGVGTARINAISFGGYNAYVSIQNQRRLATLNIQKLVDGDTVQPLAGYRFYLVDAAGNVVGDTTDGSGAAQFSGLVWGSYTLVEVTDENTTPAGFVPYTGDTSAIGLAAGDAAWAKSVQLPAQMMGTNALKAELSLEVDNLVSVLPGAVSLTKTWNGAASMPNGQVYFLLMPQDGANVADATEMVRSSNKFTAETLDEGSYTLYEVTTSRYTPAGGWTRVSTNFTYAGGSYVLWRSGRTVVVEADGTVTLSVNNTYTVPPVEPPPGPGEESSSSSSSRPTTTTSTGSSSTSGPSSSSSAPVPSESNSGGGTQSETDGSSSNGGFTAPASVGEERGRGNGGHSFWESLLADDMPIGNLTLGGSWSLLNFICSVLALLIAVVVALSALLHRKNEDEDTGEERPKRARGIVQVLAVITGILTPLLFFLLEDLTYPKVFINRWTLVIVPVFLVHIVLVLVTVLLRRKRAAAAEAAGDDNPPL